MPATTVSTVAELMAFLETLDPTMPLAHRGNMGDWPRGLVVGTVELMDSTDPEENYTAKANDPTFAKWQKKGRFGPTYVALVTG